MVAHYLACLVAFDWSYFEDRRAIDRGEPMVITHHIAGMFWNIRVVNHRDGVGRSTTGFDSGRSCMGGVGKCGSNGIVIVANRSPTMS
jgi:hypothetical protein